jgi:copper chaperone
MRESVTATLDVQGMHCASCGMLIDDALEDLDGVTSAQTSVREGRTTVQYDPARCDLDNVIAEITATGYTARTVT